MADKALEKQIDRALADMERWLVRQPAWKNGNLSNPSGSVVSHRGPTILSEADCALQFSRFLNKAGVPWRNIHIEVSPAQWLVEKAAAGASPPRIDLVIVDRDRLGKRKAPSRLHKSEADLFDAVFEFKLASNYWVRTLKNGKQAKPPARIARSIEKDVAKVRGYVRKLWASRGYVVVVEEADHRWERPSKKPVDGVSLHYLKCF